jgi:hypothetical protein
VTDSGAVKLACLLSLLLLTCSQSKLPDPAGSNNYDDPDDPGNGMNGTSPEASADANGQPCVAARDCPAAFVCAFPLSDMCTAMGRCLPYDPTGCDAGFGCGCDDSAVQMCAPSGYAPRPLQSTSACGTLDSGSDQ